MNQRILFHRLTIAVAIGMLMAAVAYRAEAPSQSVANPPVVDSKVVDSKLTIPNEKNIAPQQQQQERLARFQSRF